MPFVKKIELEHGTLGIWELTESAESLMADFQFSENEKVEFKKFSFQKRRSEYIAIRLLLQQLIGEKTEIVYQKSGRPLLINSPLNISISHSSDLVVVLISDKSVGIDVENVNRNIIPVAKRFLHYEELAWIEKTGNMQNLMILCWGAKESIFKCTQQSGVQYDTQIFIPPFEFENRDFFNGKLITSNGEELYNLWYFYFKNNMIVYCVEVKNMI